MTRILAVMVVAASIATPAFAQSIHKSGSDAALRSYAAQQAKAKQKAKAKQQRAVRTHAQAPRIWSYSTNPAYDVYVRGEYVGSDPDPRIRWTLREEARRSYGLRD